MKTTRKHLFWIGALITAIAFDQLFWETSYGVNFFLFVLIALLAGLIPYWVEKTHIPFMSYILLIPIVFFAGMTFVRAEPFTTVTNNLITIGLLLLFSITLRNGAWHHYRLRDFIENGFQYLLTIFSGAILFFKKIHDDPKSPPQSEQPENAAENLEPEQTPIPAAQDSRKQKTFLKQAAPYLRGVLIAVPILAVLASLLSQADPIFNDRIQNFFSWFRVENLGDTIFRLVYILVIAYVLLSVYYFAYVKSKTFKHDAQKKPIIPPFLGSIEANIVLVGVNLLFLLFVILQFSYLFSGGKNISAEGYTYADYARRGFFELIVVAVISVVLFYILSMLTKRAGKKQSRLFSAFGLTLVALVAIILASAYTRLTLYEVAYGFTRLRTLAHVMMVWIGLLLLGIAALEITKNLERLALLLICFILGFGLTINILNIDRFIVEQNVTRAIDGTGDAQEPELDAGYLALLSADSVSKLAAFYQDAQTPNWLRDEIGGVLACNAAVLNDAESASWTSSHLSRSRAQKLLQGLAESLEDYPVFQDGIWFVEVNGEVKSCIGLDIYGID
jgi:hypothetical protein